MQGQAFLVTSSAFGRSNSPEGAKQNLSAHAEAALKHPTQKSLADRARSYKIKSPSP